MFVFANEFDARLYLVQFKLEFYYYNLVDPFSYPFIERHLIILVISLHLHISNFYENTQKGGVGIL